MVYCPRWGRGVAGQTRGPVKAEIAGSNPVAPAPAKVAWWSGRKLTEATSLFFVLHQLEPHSRPFRWLLMVHTAPLQS